jgi:hypothetical protein
LLHLKNTSDDDVGLLLERSTLLDRNDYTLNGVVDIVKIILRQSGVDFVLFNNFDEQSAALGRNKAG